jgi:type II secretory pathway pseudopilin PulG
MKISPHTRRSAFTLLEVVLALGLAVMVMELVGSQIYTTLKLVDQGRRKTEKEQLARAILQKIAADIRATVRYEPFDSTGVSGASTSSSSTSSSATDPTSTPSSQSTNSTSSSQSGNSSSSSSTDSSSSSTASTAVQYPGLYGDQGGLQIDVARIPRVDEYNTNATDPTTQSSTVTALRTVTYYLIGSTPTTSSLTGTPTGTDMTSGLVRCEMDRAAALNASQQGDTTQRDATAASIAPEVADMQFSYFDGTTWNDTWDTTQNGGLPQAISVWILLNDVAASGQQQSNDQASNAPTSIADAQSSDPSRVYRIVVHLAACDPMQAAASSSTQSTDTSSTTGGSGGGTTTPGQ